MPSRAILILCLIGLTGGRTAGELVAETPAQRRATPELSAARKLYRDGQLREAERVLQVGLSKQAAGATQATGYLELLTSIYYDSGRYSEALNAGRRCEQALEQIKDRDASITVKRQENAVALANIYASLGRPRDALQMFEQAVALPGGARGTDALWQARVEAMQARVAGEMGDAQKAKSLWFSAESQARRILAQPARATRDATEQDEAVEILRESLMSTNQPKQAIDALQKQLARQKADPTASAKIHSDLAECYAQISDHAGEKQALLEALRRKSQQESQRSTAAFADLLDRLALVYQREQDDTKAQRCWTRAATIYERLAKQAGTDEAGLAEEMVEYQNLQRVYQRLNQWEDGARVSERLLEYRQQTKMADDPSIYRTKSALGAFYNKLDENGQAKPMLEEALAYWRSRKPPPLTELAGTLNNLAEVTRASGSYTEALEYLEEALPIYQQIYPANDFRLAELHSNLASALSGKGQYKSAIEHYLLAAEICREQHGPESRKADEVLSTTLLNTAMFYKSQRQFADAARYCQQALDVRRRSTGDDDSALLPFYLALATLHLRDRPPATLESTSADDLQQALAHAQRAKKLFESNPLANKPAAAAIAQIEGTIHLRQNDLQGARDNWQRALKLARDGNQKSSQAKTLNYLVSVELMSGGDLPAADKLSREALELHEQVQAYPNLRFVAYLNRAKVLRRLGRQDEALAALDKAIEQIEVPRAATIGAESERAEFFSQFVVAFDLLVDWNVQEKRFDQALAAAEAGRNRTFLDQVGAAGVDFRESLKGSPDEVLLRQEKETLAAYNNQLNRLRQLREANAPPASPEAIASTAAQLESLRVEYAKIETDIRGASPSYRNLLGGRDDASWSTVLPKVLATDNVLLLYYLGHSSSHLFLIDGRSGAVDHFPLEISPDLAQAFLIDAGPLTRGMAAQLVSANLEFLRRRSSEARNRGLGQQQIKSEKGTIDRQSLQAKALEQPRQRVALADILLPRMAREQIARLSPEHVVVIPDGALHQLPLEALLVEIEPPRYAFDVLPAIVYAPSATIMSILGQRHASQKDRPISLLTVGDPRYLQAQGVATREQQFTTSADYLAMGGELSRLPFTAEECGSVLRAMESAGASDAKQLLDAEATEKNVRQEILGRQFVHLAAHGLVDQVHENLFGALALAPPESATISSEDDGFLSLYEIHNLKLNQCDLVVLSACQTNVGADRPLEAGSTLARAFVAAGATRIVCTQWSVDDQSTAALIGAFFGRISAELKAGRSPDYARALQEARREVRNNPAWSEPYHWAPFVLIGPAH